MLGPIPNPHQQHQSWLPRTFAEELSAGAVAYAELGRALQRAAGWAAGCQLPRAADAPWGTAESPGTGTGAHAGTGGSH